MADRKLGGITIGGISGVVLGTGDGSGATLTCTFFNQAWREPHMLQAFLPGVAEGDASDGPDGERVEEDERRAPLRIHGTPVEVAERRQHEGEPAAQSQPDAQQQHRKTAQQPGKNPRRPRDGGHVTGREQPAGTEDRPQSDKGEVDQ